MQQRRSFVFLQVAGLLDVSAATFRFLDPRSVIDFDLLAVGGAPRLVTSQVEASVPEPGAAVPLLAGVSLEMGRRRTPPRGARRARARPNV